MTSRAGRLHLGCCRRLGSRDNGELTSRGSVTYSSPFQWEVCSCTFCRGEGRVVGTEAPVLHACRPCMTVQNLEAGHRGSLLPALPSAATLTTRGVQTVPHIAVLSSAAPPENRPGVGTSPHTAAVLVLVSQCSGEVPATYADTCACGENAVPASQGGLEPWRHSCHSVQADRALLCCTRACLQVVRQWVVQQAHAAGQVLILPDGVQLML